MGKSSRSGRRTLGPRRRSARAPASRWLREFTASYSIQLRRSPRCSRPVTEIRTRRWGSATGRSRSAKASRTLKAAVLKPIAKASEATANAVTPGFRANTRMAARSSRRIVSIWGLYAAAAEWVARRMPPRMAAWQPGRLRYRWLDFRIFLRRRMLSGVTSTNSSSRMNSMACSRLRRRGGSRRMPSSAGEERVHYGGAAGIGEDRAAQADQAAGGHMKFQAHTAGAVVDHLDHLALAGAELLDHHAQETLRAIDDQGFHRLAELVVDGARQDLGLADGQFVAFAPHHLDEDGELQFAAAHHLEGVMPQLLDADGNVGQ